MGELSSDRQARSKLAPGSLVRTAKTLHVSTRNTRNKVCDFLCTEDLARGEPNNATHRECLGERTRRWMGASTLMNTGTDSSWGPGYRYFLRTWLWRDLRESMTWENRCHNDLRESKNRKIVKVKVRQPFDAMAGEEVSSRFVVLLPCVGIAKRLVVVVGVVVVFSAWWLELLSVLTSRRNCVAAEQNWCFWTANSVGSRLVCYVNEAARSVSSDNCEHYELVSY